MSYERRGYFRRIHTPMKTTPEITVARITEQHGLFIEELKARKYSAKTLSLYGHGLDRFEAYLKAKGIREHVDVTRQDVLAYVQELRDRGYKAASVRSYLTAVTLFFGYLEERQKLFVNPAGGLTLKAPDKLPVVPSREDILKMLEAPNTGRATGVRDRAFLELAYSTGMRRAELIGLQVADVNLAEASVRVLGKGQKERILPIGRSALHWLGEYIHRARVELLAESENKALWIRKGGGRISYEAVQAIISRSRKKAGIARTLSCHDFRRAFATHMLQNGAHPVDIQHLLGHADLSKLRHYLRLTALDLKKMHAESRPGQ